MSYIAKTNQAASLLESIMLPTDLHPCQRLSERYGARSVLLKREDMTEVRSFKIRGAYNKMATLTKLEKSAGVVCASAGNHAQGER
jgi:threonine dehydratase